MHDQTANEAGIGGSLATLNGRAEDRQRVVLAGWLANLGRGGRVVHFGEREGIVAAALASAGANVVSHLKDAAAVDSANERFSSASLKFVPLDETNPGSLKSSADIIVVETAGLESVVALDQAHSALRAGGWFAVIGMPLIMDVAGLVDVGTFCVDDGSTVFPSTVPARTQLSLYRFASPSAVESRRKKKAAAPGTSINASPLSLVVNRRKHQSETERRLQRHATRAIIGPVPSQQLIDWVGGGSPSSFGQIGMLNFHQLAIYCGIKPTDQILEPGCGCGRNARIIAPFLDQHRGVYEGFDIYRPAIDWATENITEQYPNARFTFADIQNTNYNRGGTVHPNEYVFPYESDRFDVAFLPSVFTHMTRDGFEHYTREMHRVLRPGGLLLSWHFLLTELSAASMRDGKSTIEMGPYDEVSWVKIQQDPCAAIAFDETYVLEFYESLGLRAQSVMHGNWSGAEADGYQDYQDRILSLKQ